MEWVRRGGVREGFLFRSVAKEGRVGARLDASQVRRIWRAGNPGTERPAQPRTAAPGPGSPADFAVGWTTRAADAQPRNTNRAYPETENPRLGVTRMSLFFNARSSARAMACWQCAAPHEKPGS